MSIDKPRSALRLAYANSAEAYLRSLPPEHFMEATPQATQREITVESLALLKARRPDVHYFNELLVQYPHGRAREIRKVVPDNMVVLHPEPIEAVGSYDLPLQPVGPFWVLEYVSKSSRRKDYDDNFQKYERELKVPYYLAFYPDDQELTLFRRSGRKYRAVPPTDGRYPLPELDLEVALFGGWVRYWYRGERLPLPADLQRQVDEMAQQLRLAQEQARLAQEQARLAQEQARLAQEQARLAQGQADQERGQKERLLAQLRQLGQEPQL
jgi:Uma2 family endonuclease